MSHLGHFVVFNTDWSKFLNLSTIFRILVLIVRYRNWAFSAQVPNPRIRELEGTHFSDYDHKILRIATQPQGSERAQDPRLPLWKQADSKCVSPPNTVPGELGKEEIKGG